MLSPTISPLFSLLFIHYPPLHWVVSLLWLLALDRAMGTLNPAFSSLLLPLRPLPRFPFRPATCSPLHALRPRTVYQVFGLALEPFLLRFAWIWCIVGYGKPRNMRVKLVMSSLLEWRWERRTMVAKLLLRREYSSWHNQFITQSSQPKLCSNIAHISLEEFYIALQSCHH